MKFHLETMEKTSLVVCIVGVVLGMLFFPRKQGDRNILTENVSAEYDYIIVGGGSAGAVVASRLSEDPDVKVLLLEVGGFYDESPFFDIPPSWASLLDTEHVWRYFTTPQTSSFLAMRENRGFWPRGRVLGGTSVLNAMQYTRGSPFDYDEWEANGCTGWGYKDVLPYFLKSEDIQIPELMDSKFHGTGGPLTVTSGKITPLADKIMDAGKELGCDVVDYNSASPEGCGIIQLNVKNGVRASTGVAFLGGTAERNNLDISIHSFATKVEIRNKRAAGVYFIKNGLKKFVGARKEVILSAGVINSPQLLMLSGIGPKDHLSEMGIPVIADLPVGQNLQDHQGIVLASRINESLSIDMDTRISYWSQFQYALFGSGPLSVSGNEVNVFTHTDGSMKGKTAPDMWFVFGSYLPTLFKDIINIEANLANDMFPYSSSDHGFYTGVILAHPKSSGLLKLASTDPFDFPVIDSQYFTDQHDIDVMIKGIKIWEQLMQTSAMKKLGVDIDDAQTTICSEHAFRSDTYWECRVRHLASTVWHHTGTCKMAAENDSTAVVDPMLRVRGIRGLRVVDASVFPSVTSGNTNAPVIMVAEKAADMIRGKDTVVHLR